MISTAVNNRAAFPLIFWGFDEIELAAGSMAVLELNLRFNSSSVIADLAAGKHRRLHDQNIQEIYAEK